MAWIETITLTLGASIAKYILKSWLGDNLPSSILGDLVDVLKDEGEKAGEQRDSRKQIDRIGEKIAAQLLPMFKSEGIYLEENQKTAIALELARTISKAKITSKLLVDCNLDPKILGDQLQKANSKATKLFSAVETTVYQLLLTEACRAIIEISTDLASFQMQFSASLLESQDRIYESLAKLLAVPSEKSYRYEEEYRQIVSDNLNRVEMFGVPQYDIVARKQSLTIAYIGLEVNISNAHKIEKEEIPEWLITEKNKTDLDAHRVASAETEQLQNAPVNHLLAQARCIVIRGYAGSGKTTLMKWIAVRSALHDFPSSLAGWNNTVPFFIPLREYVDRGFPELEEFPRSIARMVGGKPEDWVHQQLDLGRAVIIIDGVDELPSSKRSEMLQRLDQLVKTYPFARYIVTSRPHALKADLWPEWQEWITAQGFVETILQPMNPTCMEEFIDHWHTALNEAITDEQEKEEIKGNPDSLKRLLRRRPALRRLATNPLLCAMICALYRERRQSLPSERLKLYQECVEMLISRREEPRMAGLRGDYPELSYSQQFALIQGFAYWLMHNGYSDVETKEADHYFDSRLPNLSINGTSGENVRRFFVERASLLTEPVIGRVNFTHRTFQEYLAARAAVDASDFGFLAKNSLDDQWQEVIILAAGEARPKEHAQLLKKLISKAGQLKRKNNQRQINLLALACLETCVDLDPEIRHLVLDRATDVFPPKNDEEAKLIAAAGDPAVDLLSPKINLERNEAYASVKALAMIGSDLALEMISKYAQDERFKDLGYEELKEYFEQRTYLQRVLSHLLELVL